MHTLIQNGTLINEGKKFKSDILIFGDRIERAAELIIPEKGWNSIDAEGLIVMPGMIDSHVHFREPGLTYKGTIESESKAAVLGGVTSYFDMPNTVPFTDTVERLEAKVAIAHQFSLANYSFYFGVHNENVEQALDVDNEWISGITDDGLYFDRKDALICSQPEMMIKVFEHSKSLFALHCENEELIYQREQLFRDIYGTNIRPAHHAIIRNEDVCFFATSGLIEAAKRKNTRLHLLHLSTRKEAEYLSSRIPIEKKRITGEVCIHHLYFDADDYTNKGMKIKWNPAIKEIKHKNALIKGLLENRLDTIATDHAPHLLSEKNLPYFESKSGAPLTGEALSVLFELYHQGQISLELIVQKACHNPAIVFKIKERGYLREGYFADIVLADIKKWRLVTLEQLSYTCGWSPLEGAALRGTVHSVWVNGTLTVSNGKLTGEKNSQRIRFEKWR